MGDEEKSEFSKFIGIQNTDKQMYPCDNIQ